ncbi:MAG TPA: VanW family protein, partial [Chloroflexota bacterium]|nr:VanW family protein [Chloroflexota bacterium]
ASVELKEEPLEAVVNRAAQEIDQEPVNARFALGNGQLKLTRPGEAGRAVAQQAGIDLLRKRIEAGERSVALPVDVVPPPVSSDAAAKLGVPELIDESTTSFVGAIPEKAHNIQLAATRLNGVVVPPGGTFSFNKEVGPTTIEAGFQWGFGLTTGGQPGGVHTVPSVAGGICQVATTLFQPVFWAGYQLEERYWHLYWIPSYTSRGFVGLDATVDPDAGLDLKWINPTSDYVLIQASADTDKVTFRLYGRKPAWSVHVDEPVISNKIAPDPTPDVQPEPALDWGRVIAVETAREGFDVVLRRNVVPTDGHPARELLLKSIYAPAHTVTLVGTRGAPDQGSVSASVERTLQSLRPAPPAAPAPSAPAVPARPSTYSTPNGQRTLPQIRDELRRAGWGGGSDQDALETYNRVAAGN